MRKHIIPKVITVLFLWVLVLLPLQAGAGLPIVRSVDSSLLTQPPQSITFYVYDAQDAQEPVQIQHREAGQWQADVDLQSWPLMQERSIRFQAELSDFEFMPTDGPLWVEMVVDGVAVGERSTLALNAAGTGGFSSAGIIESRTGGFRFPDGSVQTTAASGTGSGSGTVTSVTAGSGLAGGTITTTGTISVDTSQTQSRVSGSCPAGSSIRAIAVDGTVSCENDDMGATMSDLTNHASTSSAHHSRYVDSEAVTAIKAADGTGFALDADLLDGLHASEVIASAVAQSAVATPISSLPYTITQPGSYYVTSNLDGSGMGNGGVGINILADNVTLDLMGFTLDGGGAANSTGIRMMSSKKVTLKNGTVRRFGKAGIYHPYTLNGHMKILNVRSLDNGHVAGAGAGIHVGSRGAIVIGCVAGNNAGMGIRTGSSAIVKQNTVYGNGGGSGTALSSVHGIGAGSGSLVIGNTVYDHKAEGLQAGAINVNPGSIVRNNAVYRNRSWGIRGDQSLIKDNVVSYNNQQVNPDVGGIEVSSRNLVVGNQLSFNQGSGIVVSGKGNVLKENHVSSSSIGSGIRFDTSHNYYRDNTASQNGVNFNVGSFTITDGGGNVGF